MKLLFSQSFLKRASQYNVTIEDLTAWIQKHFHNCTLLCSPIDDTKAYKGYYSGVERVILFHVSQKGVIYPVYIGDKHDPIAKNITVSLVKKHAEKWLDMFLSDLQAKKIQVRHIKM